MDAVSKKLETIFNKIEKTSPGSYNELKKIYIKIKKISPKTIKDLDDIKPKLITEINNIKPETIEELNNIKPELIKKLTNIKSEANPEIIKKINSIKPELLKKISNIKIKIDKKNKKVNKKPIDFKPIYLLILSIITYVFIISSEIYIKTNYKTNNNTYYKKNYNTNFNDKYGINILRNKEQISKKCRELKIKYHPDKHFGKESEYTKIFQEISNICDKKLALY